MICIGHDALTRIENWVPVFISADDLAEIWDKDSLAAVVSVADPEPKRCWFYYSSGDELISISLGKGSISLSEGIQFDNGRHRTRWMLDKGIPEIPILLTSESFRRALSMGLRVRQGLMGEVIPGLTEEPIESVK